MFVKNQITRYAYYNSYGGDDEEQGERYTTSGVGAFVTGEPQACRIAIAADSTICLVDERNALVVREVGQMSSYTTR